ncbi:hypothetical protein Zmor_014464 [Zophobas morio]|uniref:Putative nuclease HARBI1 n=1 Tax=Zophobas morio TaxID=2755281 RepID=A0AA38MGW2_9CUCU|nr:hypothetical protein Zmor_014464 [Zophobas morio]
MDNVLQEIQFIEEVENNFNIYPLARARGVFRPRINTFAEFSEKEFIKRYRLKKHTFRYVLDLIKEDLRLQTYNSNNISPEMQLLIALRFFAKASYQTETGDLHGVSQASVSRIVLKVARALASRLPQFVNWPENFRELKRNFYNIRAFPGVVGCIDCTHIKIKNPDGRRPLLYCCRKGFYSLNVQVICDSNTRIMDIVTRWRGNVHDSRIFNNSRIKEDFESNLKQGILLGDSGYACTRYMLTPLLQPRTAAELRYNAAHKGTRVVIEHCFGRWKNMFKALRRNLETKLSTAKIVIVATAILYNIRLERDNNFEDDSSESDSDNDDQPIRPNPRNEQGNIFRRLFIQRYFGNNNR